ncbi:MAG: radical SAM protein [Candidatus Thermoplasmatota archaeon]
MYDPVVLARNLEPIVSEGVRRRYYRFRGARWYGGIATGDVTGCNLRCAFCWAGDDLRENPKAGRLYSPQEAADALVRICRARGYAQVRLSGQEPTIGREHLLALLKSLEGKGLTFILETNGILLGAEREYAVALRGIRHLHVRVSIKGCSEAEFSALTGACPAGFSLQLKGLEHLIAEGVRCHPSVMVSFSDRRAFERLRQRLAVISPKLAHEIEIEELILYPLVVRRLKRLGITYHKGHEPDNVPSVLV